MGRRLVRLGFLLLIWNLASASGSDVISSAPIMEAQDKLLKFQIDIVRSSTELACKNILENLNGIKARFTELESDLEKLVDVHQRFVRQIEMNRNNSSDGPLKTAQMTGESSPTNNKDKNLTDIIDAIKDGRFLEASEKLSTNNRITQIPTIIREIYANSDANFNLLFSFSKTAPQLDLKLSILESLHEEVLKDGQQNPRNMTMLAMDIRYLSWEHLSSREMKVKARALFEQLINPIKSSGTEYLVNAMQNGNYGYNLTAKNFLTYVDALHSSLCDEIIRNVVNATFGRVDTDTILTHFYKLNYETHAIQGISELFWKLKETNGTNDDIFFKIASHLRDIRGRYNYDSLSDSYKDLLNKMVANLPSCAKNLFFKPSVCLWNKETNSFLFAADSALNHDKNRRNIFVGSSPSEKPTAAASWMPQDLGKYFSFKNVKYPDEYLYVSKLDQSRRSRFVFNWIPGKYTNDQSAFIVKPAGDFCYLKNVYFAEYLYASDVKHQSGNENLHVLTQKDGFKDETPQFLWQIQSC